MMIIIIILKKLIFIKIKNKLFKIGRHMRFATASNDGTIKTWDLVEYFVISTSFPRKDQERGVTPLCLAFADLLLSGWSDGRFFFFK
jgi:hypothetical protein